MKIRNALLIAGAILVASAIIAIGDFEDSNLIVSTIMVLISIGVLLNAYYKDGDRLKKCLKKRPLKGKALKVALMVTAVFFGMGFAVGKLIYLWTH